MTRKRKKSRKSRAGRAHSSVNLSQEALEAQARAHLQAGKYREAISEYKRLLEQEQRPQWRDSLAEAYAGRAQGLADKGMLKEAAVIWRNRAESCDRFLAEPAYLELLLQTGQNEAALELIREQRRQIEAHGHLPWLRVFCAVQTLAGEEAFLALFADDDPLRRDFPEARAALQAYCSGRDEELDRHLKAIPFRSPFRDFRQILKALSLLERDAAAALSLLGRVDAGSPFHLLATTIEASQAPDSDFLREYQRMGKAQRRFAATLRGWSAEQLSRVQELQQLGDHPNADKLLRFLLRHQAALGDAYVRESALRILVHHPRGVSVVSKSLGRLSRFDQTRIEALRLEADGLPHEIYNSWSDLCLQLIESKPHPGSINELTLALLLRRMARQWLRSEPPDHQVLLLLDRALRHDPDDRRAYVELIGLYRNERKLKDARRVLDKALERYPEDTEVLIEAVQTALAGSAYKKAARYARRALELDPINPRVREILLNAHLAHARKQIQQKKTPLARKELDEAVNWARTEAALGRIDLVQAMLEASDAEHEEARRRFHAGYERMGGGLAGRFQLLMEAGRMQRPMASVLKQAQLPKAPRQASREQVLLLIQALGETDTDEERLEEALEFLQVPLRSAAKLEFSQPEMEHLCETWSRLGQQDLRTRYARAALKHWPDAPVFVFHEIDAGQDFFIDLSAGELQRLQTAFERARTDGDMRTAHRIGELLHAGQPFAGPDEVPFGFDDDAPSLPTGEDLEQFIDILIWDKGPPVVEEMKRELGPEGARQFIRGVLSGHLDVDEVDDMLGNLAPPKPRRRARKKSSHEDPDQFELF